MSTPTSDLIVSAALPYIKRPEVDDAFISGLSRSTMIDTQYFDQLADQINSVSGCRMLQNLVNEAFDGIQQQIYDIEKDLVKMSPALALLTLSITDLPSVITAVTQIVQIMVGPYVEPYLKQVAAMAALAASVAKLTEAIENASSSFTDCKIDVPKINIIPPVL